MLRISNPLLWRCPTGELRRLYDRNVSGRHVDIGAVEERFKAADKNSNGALEGTETNAYKASMTKIDTNKDGKVTREEFLAASKSGVIR